MQQNQTTISTTVGSGLQPIGSFVYCVLLVHLGILWISDKN